VTAGDSLKRGEWIVTPAEANQRLDLFLVSRATLGSRSQVQRLIRQGHVRVDTAPAKVGALVRAGQCVSLDEPPVLPPALEPEAIDLDVLYEDACLLVINKPAGLVVHPAPGHWRGTLVHALLHRWQGAVEGMMPLRLGIVHRLDKDTSGVLIIAKDSNTLDDLGRQFRAREVHKCYAALAWGHVRPATGIVRAAIARHRVHRKRMTVHPRGRAAVTRYDVIEHLGDITFLRLFPETGRTHQIRVHLAALGHPIVSDAQYAGARNRRAAPIDRQALHAERIEFRHPRSGAIVRVTAPLAPDFAAALTRLRAERTANRA
jgi:23S rRNA pseudouridine1911/1915/1917 synthase